MEKRVPVEDAPDNLRELVDAFITDGQAFIAAADDYITAEQQMYGDAEHLQAAFHLWAAKAEQVIQLDEKLAVVNMKPSDAFEKLVSDAPVAGMTADEFNVLSEEFRKLSEEGSVAISKYNQAVAVCDNEDLKIQKAWKRWKASNAALEKVCQTLNTHPSKLSIGEIFLKDIIKAANVKHHDLSTALTRFKNTASTMTLVDKENSRLWNHEGVVRMKLLLHSQNPQTE